MYFVCFLSISISSSPISYAFIPVPTAWHHLTNVGAIPVDHWLFSLDPDDALFSLHYRRSLKSLRELAASADAPT